MSGLNSLNAKYPFFFGLGFSALGFALSFTGPIGFASKWAYDRGVLAGSEQSEHTWREKLNTEIQKGLVSASGKQFESLSETYKALVTRIDDMARERLNETNRQNSIVSQKDEEISRLKSALELLRNDVSLMSYYDTLMHDLQSRLSDITNRKSSEQYALMGLRQSLSRINEAHERYIEWSQLFNGTIKTTLERLSNNEITTRELREVLSKYIVDSEARRRSAQQIINSLRQIVMEKRS
jgi:small-conductance mechanosensitive channel